MGLRLPDFIIDIGPTVVSGVIAAYVSALVVTKIYRDYNLLFATILPFCSYFICLFIGDILIATDVGWSTKSIGVLLREVVTIGAYYYFLKDGVLKK